jgi:ribosomal protein L11 methyltransferase
VEAEGRELMPQTRLFLTTTGAKAGRIARVLEAEFEEDALPVSSFEIDEKAGIWSVSLYVQGADVEAAEKRMAAALERAGLPHGIGHEPLADIDWVAATLAELTPVRSGRFIVHGSHDRHVPQPWQHAMLIDAGLAFGTGHHGTTAGCLDMLGQCLKQRRYFNALDLGTGSGVLAIAVAKSLPIDVLASDIDPVATQVARQNARINGVASRVECITATGFNHRLFGERGPFDLVLANILARPLETLARDLARHLARPATVILSGLLPHQQARIVAAYRSQGLRLVKAHHREGWLTLVLEFPARA